MITIDQEVVKDEENAKQPEDGIHVLGLNMEGCRWDRDSFNLAESLPKVLFSPSPMFWFIPEKKTEQRNFHHYKCPVYKTTERKGVLMTTGHSTNFVMMLKFNTDIDADHWIKRGAACILSLDD